MNEKKETLYSTIKNISEEIVSLIKEHGPLTRIEISEFLGYEKHSWGYSGHSTLTIKIDKLLKESKIVRFIPEDNKVGRPSVYYKLPEELDRDSLDGDEEDK